MSQPLLVSIVELGGYPDYTPLYQRAGFRVLSERKMRKAMALIKREKPGVIVAEFNFQSDFRDRTSSLESLMSVAERLPDCAVIVFFEREYEHQLQRLLERSPVYRTFPFPIDETALAECVAGLAGQEDDKRRDSV